MKKYKEVPQWWYLVLLFSALVIGIGCSVRGWVFKLSSSDLMAASRTVQQRRLATPRLERDLIHDH